MPKPYKELILVSLLMVFGVIAVGSLCNLIGEVIGGRSEKLVYLSVVCGVSTLGTAVAALLRRRFKDRQALESKSAVDPHLSLAPNERLLYRFDRNLEMVQQGSCDLARALKVYEECYSSGLSDYDFGEDAMEATSFGLSRSNEDFIEVSCHAKDLVTVYSDRLFPARKSGWLGSSGSHLEIKGDKYAVSQVINDYFILDREAFEAKCG